MAAEIHEDNVGTRFLLLIKDQDGAAVNLSTLSTKSIVFKKPDTVKVTKTASFLTDGSDGYIYYDTVSGDLDQSGNWSLQADLTFTGGNRYLSDVENFKVWPNL